jgi:SSS family solute:Na+ symporter
MPLALIGWVAGCAMIWSSLFTVGNFLYGRYGYAFALLGIFLISGTVVLRVVNKLWTD